MVESEYEVSRTCNADRRVENPLGCPDDSPPESSETAFHKQIAQIGLFLFIRSFLIVRGLFAPGPFLWCEFAGMEFDRLVHSETDRACAYQQAVRTPFKLFP